MSNHKTGENPVGRKSKVSRATVIVPGLVGPKPRRISVGDGQQVNIPVQVLVVKQFTENISERMIGFYPSKSPGNRIQVKVILRDDDSGAGSG